MKMRIAGKSMKPLFDEGQEVLIGPFAGGRHPRRGDILAIRPDPDAPPILHRVAELRRGLPLTKGDANRKPEGPWDKDRIVGRLLAIRDQDGNWRVPRPLVQSIATLFLILPVRFRYRLNLLLRPFLHGGILHIRPKPVIPHAGPCTASSTEEDLPEWLETQELGRELFIHDTRTGDVVILNGTARAIWAMSRSGLDADQIVKLLTERYPDQEPLTLRGHVAEALEQVAGLLHPA